jgi:hypothetical protein
MRVLKHFKDQMPEKAKKMKKAADRGLEEGEAEDMVVDGESSGFEDVDSD